MGFYDLSKEERNQAYQTITQEVYLDLKEGRNITILKYFGDEDTYIRKAGYLAMGKIAKADSIPLASITDCLEILIGSELEKVRQTTINAAGELGKDNFQMVSHFFDRGLFDEHHSVRNAVIGSIKKMGQVNPQPVLKWAKGYLQHPDKEIRREICHGIELRGRTHPEDILPLLKQLQFDKTARVKNTLVHVLGQIAYKKGCLATVISELLNWENKELVHEALEEIIDVHHRYRSFAVLSQNEAIAYIRQFFHEEI